MYSDMSEVNINCNQVVWSMLANIPCPGDIVFAKTMG
jgi:hypothetical protein